jgi:predicted phage baseplate assembly protein
VPVEAARRRGPLELRARGRAVAAADYALLARQAPGARVARAHAAGGFHPDVPGRPVPGLVGVLVVPADRGDGPPLPDQGTLDAVARHLVERAAPAGVQVVVGAPTYERVRVEGQLVAARGADLGVVLREAIAAVNRWLDPVDGGDDGQGWPFGRPIRHAALVRRLLGAVPELRAVPSLSLVVDGRRLPLCADHALAEHALPWPAAHELVPVTDGGATP